MNKDDLKKYREDHGLSQAELADIVGVKVGTVQSWEQGKRNVGQSAIKLLQEYDTKKEEKAPQIDVRLEDIFSKSLLEELKPYLKDFQQGHISTGKQVHDLTELVKSLTSLVIKLKYQIGDLQKDVNLMKEQAKEVHDVVVPTK